MAKDYSSRSLKRSKSTVLVKDGNPLEAFHGTRMARHFFQENFLWARSISPKSGHYKQKKSDLKLWTIAFDHKISGYPLRFGLSGNFGSIFGRVTQIFLVSGPVSDLL